MRDTISPLRWVLKKNGRVALGALSAPLCALRTLIASPPKVRVLTYHYFGDEPRAPFFVSGRDFASQMSWLKDHDLVITLAEFRDLLSGKLEISTDKVLISIDDGHESVTDIALPILADFDVEAIIFVVADWIGREGYLDKVQLKEIDDHGIEIGSHSMTHQSMGKINADMVLGEMRESRLILQDVIGASVTSFAYPYGTRNDFSDVTKVKAREAGYELIFTSQHGAVAKGADPLEIPRIKVEGGDPGWHFPALCKGAMDYWRVVDTIVPFLQKPHGLSP